MRVVKDPVVRKSEILDAAENLFITKGYNETSILDIVNTVKVAKGTFYYYFKSKEEILDEVLLRLISEDEKRMNIVLHDTTLSPIKKMTMLILAQQPQPGDKKNLITEEFHKPGNAEMHQRGAKLGLVRLAPILAQAVREGVEQGVFSTDTPLEDVEMMFAASFVMFDEVITAYTPEEAPKKAAAFLRNAERILGAKQGSFDEMLEFLLYSK